MWEGSVIYWSSRGARGHTAGAWVFDTGSVRLQVPVALLSWEVSGTGS